MTATGYGFLAMLIAVIAAVGIVKFLRGEGTRWFFMSVYFFGPILFAFIRKWRGL